jgi:nitrite reductase/ring-hydroxylating ferredoxin subunit
MGAPTVDDGSAERPFGRGQLYLRPGAAPERTTASAVRRVGLQAKAPSFSELSPGGMKAVDLGALTILLADVDGEVCAACDAYAHEDAYLIDGRLERRPADCPLRFSESGLETGEVRLPSAEKPIPVSNTSTKDGYIYAEV